MEYASIIWDPHTQANINRLEMVQRRYARFVFHDYQRTSSVTEMLNKLDATLQERKAHAKVYIMYSIKNSFVDIPSSILPAPSNTRTRRGQSKMLYIPHARTLTYQRSFIPDAARLWNSLPDRIFNCTSPLNFKEEVHWFLIGTVHCPHNIFYPAHCTWLHCTPYQYVDTPHGGLYFTERRRRMVHGLRISLRPVRCIS